MFKIVTKDEHVKNISVIIYLAYMYIHIYTYTMYEMFITFAKG